MTESNILRGLILLWLLDNAACLVSLDVDDSTFHSATLAHPSTGPNRKHWLHVLV